MEDLQEDRLAVHCFYVFSGSAHLRDLHGASISVKRYLLSILSIYPMIFLRVFVVYRLLSTIFSCVLVVLV